MKNSIGDIGLALSGGGSRAIAFHLGTFRALKSHDLLNRVKVISAVSGGAVLGAMYYYFDGDFSNFDQRVLKFLEQGIERDILLATFSPEIAPKILKSNIHGLWARLVRSYSNPVNPIRVCSRTDAFQLALKRRLFSDINLGSSPRSDRMKLVLNATEVSTGTAFRFGSHESGNWRLGTLEDNDSVEVATAVTASAAFPVFLPALDRVLRLRKGDEVLDTRTILTDGGIYDNLGITCFDPNREAHISTNVHQIDTLIASQAGTGEICEDSIPYGSVRRLKECMNITHKKAQDYARTQAYQWLQSKKLSHLLLPFLGQKDEQLPFTCSNFVRRERVANYPTNFSAMAATDIEYLTKRGEQVTKILIEHYLL